MKNLLVLFAGVAVLVACAPAGIYHTVQPGQTLYRIARTYEIDEVRLARINGIKDPTQLKVQQRLYIPGVTRPRQVPVSTGTTTGTRAEAAGQPAAPARPAAGPAAPAVKKPATATAAPAVTATTATRGIFIWPAKGKLLNSFGSQGQKVYKGIEIDLPSGTTVVAAASGKVIYSGNAIPGYGNLVILEHSDSFFSVYGYNLRNLVKMNDHVGQGDKIALSGLPPNGQSSRLHFEIRKGKSAVNPILYLP